MRYTGQNSICATEFQDVEVLWIRWFGRDTSATAGFQARRLPLIGFVESSDPDAFGFLNPELVLRSIHIIPAFHHGRTKELLGPSAIRHTADEDEDWKFYYVNM